MVNMSCKKIKTFMFFSMLIMGLACSYSEQSLAAACTPSQNPPSKNGKIPTKTIKIYNNTDETIYPLIETNTNDVDEWLQAYFGVCNSNSFKHTQNYRIYVNGMEGVAPHSFVALSVPLYTKLTGDTDPVTGPDKYINWWNGGRIKIYNSLVTYSDDFAKDKDKKVTPNSGGVTCVKTEEANCKNLDIYAGEGALPDNAPNQLTEYTFAGAPMGENGLRIWAIQDVDWDVSYVDSVYLPIAMGVMGNKYIGYTGTTLDTPTFTGKMNSFLSQGNIGYNWSHYNIPGDDAGSIIKLPGTYNYIRGILNKTVSTPPQISPVNKLFVLWRSCFPETKYYDDIDAIKEMPNVPCTGALKSDMQKVQNFFLQNLTQYQNLSKDKSTGCDYDRFTKTLTDQNVPMNVEMLARIYGWVPFNDYCANASAVNSLCKTSIKDDENKTDPDPTKCTKEYFDIHQTYRNLEYSYTGTNYPADQDHTFNPYVELIHGQDFLNMHGYAFSIDDAVGNMQESGNGLIIAIGGVNGLENTNPYDPKTAIIVTMGKPQTDLGRPTWKSFAACDANSSTPCVPDSNLPEGGLNFKLGTIDKFPVKVVIKDSADRIYQFTIQEGPSEKNHYYIPTNAITDCKVTDKEGKPVANWCASYQDDNAHGTPYAHTELDENKRPVNYISTNDPP